MADMSATERPRHAVFVDRSQLERLLEERRLSGIGRFDETWEGVVHLAPMPSDGHSRVRIELIAFLAPLIRRKGIGKLSECSVREPGTGDQNFRNPDLSFISNARKAIAGPVWIEGGPDVVFEIRSPGDETYQKKQFYADRGVAEMVVIDAETKRVELFRPPNADDPVPPAADGSVLCEPLGVVFRRAERPDGTGVLEAWDADDPAQRVEI